jgi:hypothetical protein
VWRAYIFALAANSLRLDSGYSATALAEVDSGWTLL